MTCKPEMSDLGDCRCGGSVLTARSELLYDNAHFPSDGASEKCASEVSIPDDAAKFCENSAVINQQLCNSTRPTVQHVPHGKYTVSDWQQTNYDRLKASKRRRNKAEKLKNNSLRAISVTDRVVTGGQKESFQYLGERIGDVIYWQQETVLELKANLTETDNFSVTKRQCECLLRELDHALRVVQECLLSFSHRVGIDQVQADVELGLLREMEVIKSLQERICRLLERIEMKLQDFAEIRQCLERDSLDKLSAVCIDKQAQDLTNTSPGIAFHPGIEQADLFRSTPQTWMDWSIRQVQRSHCARAEGARLRDEAADLLNTAVRELRQAWDGTNQALSRRRPQ